MIYFVIVVSFDCLGCTFNKYWLVLDLLLPCMFFRGGVPELVERNRFSSEGVLFFNIHSASAAGMHSLSFPCLRVIPLRAGGCHSPQEGIGLPVCLVRGGGSLCHKR